ncbi:hypothetical protein ACE1SV_65610 [Streptomyces sp. E-15]
MNGRTTEPLTGSRDRMAEPPARRLDSGAVTANRCDPGCDATGLDRDLICPEPTSGMSHKRPAVAQKCKIAPGAADWRHRAGYMDASPLPRGHRCGAKMR